MRLLVDTSAVSLVTAGPPEPSVDFDTKAHRTEDDGQFVFNVHLFALGGSGDAITVRIGRRGCRRLRTQSSGTGQCRRERWPTSMRTSRARSAGTGVQRGCGMPSSPPGCGGAVERGNHRTSTTSRRVLGHAQRR
jgi:hypothetical protein